MAMKQTDTAKTTARLAIVDDDPEIQVLLREIFQTERYEVTVFSAAEELLGAVKGKSAPWDVIICDLMLGDLSGLELIEKLHELSIEVPVILITANATIETAAAALKKGAFDYIAKPINITELTVITDRAVKLQRLERQYQDLQEKVRRTTSLGEMVGKSAGMQKVFDLIERVAKAPANVLVTGESGTGKEMVARAIHQKSDRSGKPFIAINCSAIPDSLLESELFGHKKGAFTGANEDREGLFEEAEGGTIFLDEIGDMPLDLQAKLLRVIQERKVKPLGDNKLRDIDVRIIAATHADLKKSVEEDKFREDLYYRLCVFPIVVPPLRDRREDIIPLAEHFLEKFCRSAKVRAKSFSKNALSKLVRLRWAGNVRELENAIERAVLLADKDLVDENHFHVDEESERKLDGMFSKLPTLAQLERDYIQFVLAETGGKKEEASDILGINRKTLYRKAQEYGFPE